MPSRFASKCAGVLSRLINSADDCHTTAIEAVNCSRNVQFPALDSVAQDRAGCFQSFHIEDDVLFDGIVEQIARLIPRSLHGRSYSIDQQRNVTRKFFAILHSLDRCIYSTALAVSQNEDEGCAKHCDGVFEAGDRIVIGEIAGNAADKEVSSADVESVFWSYTRICASQNSGERILSKSQCRTFANVIVRLHFSFHVTIISFHQALKGLFGRENVLRFRRSFALRGLRSRKKAKAKRGSARESKKAASSKIWGTDR